MEMVKLFMAVLLAAAIMWPCFQWYTWYHRAVSTMLEARHYKGVIEGMQLQLNNVADERKLHHDTLTLAFDFINEDDSWGARDVDRRKLRSKLMDVLRDAKIPANLEC